MKTMRVLASGQPFWSRWSRAMILPLAVASSSAIVATAQPVVFWEAFNDHRPNPAVTSATATTYDLGTAGDKGPLRDIATGDDVSATLQIVVEGAVPDNFGANSQVNPGSPADKLFKGKVDIGNEGLPGIRASASTKLTLRFINLDTTKRYKFRGTVSRGGGYNDRWSLFTLTETEAFVAAHEDGSNNRNIFTKITFPTSDLLPNQVALNTGDNKAGSLVGWDNIEPSPDGTFAIIAEQYTGVAPFGTPRNAGYGYGFNAIYIAEVESTGNLRITENPESLRVPAGKTASFTVGAASPSAITYQWQKAPSGSETFASIPGATSATYTTPALAVSEDGTRYRCEVSSAGVKTTSGEATLSVDGTIPTVTGGRPSINFNSFYVTFSEAMKLDQLANPDAYQISGGVSVLGAVALDPTTARILTSSYNPAAEFTVSIRDLEDIAGNTIAAGSQIKLTSYALTTGYAGLDVWNNITGGAPNDLRTNPRYPLEMDVDYALTALDSLQVIPNGPINTYGGRIRAWLVPAETAEYDFFIRGDDQAEMRLLLEDETFDNIDSTDITATIVDTNGGDFQEPGIDGSTTGSPLFLEAGRRYPLQIIWKESNGNDYCQVAWRKVGDPTPAVELQPIPGEFLQYFGVSSVGGAITKATIEQGKLVLEWSGTALESSDNLVDWQPVAGAASPYSVNATGSRKFFRARN